MPAPSLPIKVWANTPTTDPDTGFTNTQQPPDDYLAVGFKNKDFVPRQFLNWFLKMVGLWLSYLNAENTQRIADIAAETDARIAAVAAIGSDWASWDCNFSMGAGGTVTATDYLYARFVKIGKTVTIQIAAQITYTGTQNQVFFGLPDGIAFPTGEGLNVIPVALTEVQGKVFLPAADAPTAVLVGKESGNFDPVFSVSGTFTFECA